MFSLGTLVGSFSCSSHRLVGSGRVGRTKKKFPAGVFPPRNRTPGTSVWSSATGMPGDSTACKPDLALLLVAVWRRSDSVLAHQDMATVGAFSVFMGVRE